MVIARDVPTRPRINVSRGELHRWANEAWDALVAANDTRWPRVFVRGNALVRRAERGELEEYTAHSLRDELSAVAEFGKYGGQGEWYPQTPPMDVIQVLLNRDSARYIGAPRVDGIVDVPVVAADGSIITTPGYHEAGRVIYVPADKMGEVAYPSTEFAEEVEWARDFLMRELLGDFVWADEASKANALGLVLLPFVRHLIDGPTPMHLIVAPEPGSGKTLLAQAGLLPGCGVVPVTPDAVSDDQWRKGLTAALLSGARALLFDNLRRQLDTGSLAAALTSDQWSDRILGESKQVTLPIRNVWVATGNNVSLTDEQARRATGIFLDPGDVRPSDRPASVFRHPDLLGWAREHRAQLVTAALTLVCHWQLGHTYLQEDGQTLYRVGEPFDYDGPTLGSFGDWANVIGGILEAVGVSGFLGNRERLYDEANVERKELSGFLTAWHDAIPEPIKTRDLASRCLPGGTSPSLHDHLPTELVGARDLEKELRYWLRAHKNQRAGGFQLVAEERAHVNWWYVRRSTV